MAKNLANWDRVLRALVGLALVVLGGWVWEGWQGSWYGIISVIAGGILVLTALIGFCPCYWVCKISTAPKEGGAR